MSYEKPRIVDVRGRTITIAHLEQPNAPSTILTVDAAASATSFTVLDTAGFAQNQYVVLGQLGVEQSEIKTVNAAVSAGTALTLTTSTFAHGAGTPLKRILFNQWRIYGNSTNTTSGATLVATVDVQVDAPQTTYVNTSTEFSFYFALPYDSAAGITSTDYSDGVANSTSYADNTVGSLMNASLDEAKGKMGGVVTNTWFLREINDCLRFITGKLKRWSYLESFDYVLGTALRGTYSFAIPSDIEDANSNKSILGVRVGADDNLTYQDKRQWENRLQDVIRTEVRTEGAVGATTLAIDNSYDFADSGTVVVYVSGTQYDITYTGVTRSATAGILSGVPASGTGSITATIPVDTNVWQSESEGEPSYFTVYDGNLYLWPLPDSSSDNKNVYLDYHTKRTAVDSMSDAIEGSRYDAVKHWLVWKLRSLSNATGQKDLNDGDYLLFKEILRDLIRLETSGQKYKKRPRYNFIDYGTGNQSVG